MTPERWAEAERLFESALARPDAERAAYVTDAASDPEVAALVAGMLEADAAERGGEGELIDVVSHAVAQVTAETKGPPVDRLGPYRLLSLLGEGGMGSVFLAERDDDEFLQRVAVKIVRGVLDSERVRQFRAERQILAWLEHPNIARLLDGGTTDRGLPYLVMEHVSGVPIDRYCDDHRLPVGDRLRLFLTVCDAISHAHRSLIVHRDIKPNNILVTPAGVPKLLDFGIARLALEEAESRPAAPAPGRMMTPDYASPEVVRGGQITTSADVYALGVLLYELLTGRRPLHFATMTSAEIERVVCHVEPRAPSAVASDDGPGGSAVERAQRRATTPARLRRVLGGDLDAIIARALHKDPADRYVSADALAADVRHHLEGDPVTARPPTWRYRARRFVGRHRWGTAVAALAVLVLSTAAVMFSVQARRLADERDRTTRERDTAQQVLGFLTSIFEVANPDAGDGRSVTARELLDRGAERIDAELAGQPVVQARLLGTMGSVFGGLGLYDRAATLLERSLQLRRATLGPEHVDTAQAMSALADAYRELARYDEAEALDRDALALKRRLGDTPTSVAASLNDLGLTLCERGKPADGEPLLREAIDTWKRVEGAAAPIVAVGLNNLALSLRQQGRLAEAVPVLQEAIAIRRQRFGNDHPLLANALGHLGQVENMAGNLPEAEALLRETLAIRRKAYGDDHPDTASSFNNLASLLQDEGDLAGAEPLYRAALASTETRLGRRHPDYAVQLNNLGSLLEDGGRVKEAEALYRESLEVRRATYGAEHPAVARALHNLARATLALGRPGEAAPLAEQAWAMRRKLLPPRHAEIALSEALVADVMAARGQRAESERLLTEALAAQRAALGADHPAVATTLLKLARLARQAGRAADAEVLAREAVDVRVRRLPAGHWLLAEGRVELAEAALAVGKRDQARTLLAAAVEVMTRRLGREDPRTRRASALLATAAGDAVPAGIPPPS